MHKETGIVLPKEDWEKILKAPVNKSNDMLLEVEPKNISKEHRERLKTIGVTKIGRNEPCPCGSGYKYKKCCLNKRK